MTVEALTRDRLDTEHGTVHINAERCAGCQECAIRCPTHALRLDPEQWIVHADDALCVGCRQCERVCPFNAVTVRGPMVVSPRQEAVLEEPEQLLGSIGEIRPGLRDWDEALVEANRCLQCPDPTCMEGCPAHIDIPAFIDAVRVRDLTTALHVINDSSMLPGVCSRVCDQTVQCEGACSWALAGGQAVSIGTLERFVADHGPAPRVERSTAEGAGLSVAVVGSGPAGCATAWYLLSAGARVTIIEQSDEIGGVLRWGIPTFTLPDSVTDAPLRALQNAGVTLRTGCTLGVDVTVPGLLAEYNAVVLAHGAARPLTVNVPGIDLPGVEDATEFLIRAKDALNAGKELRGFRAGSRVLVVGGGNTAMDVARTARRLGAEVVAIEWMDRRFARVRPDELAEARAEGVDVRFTTTLQRLDGDGGGVRTAWLRRTHQSSVKRRPRVLRGAAEAITVDRVVVALGYRVDPSVTGSMVSLPIRAESPAGAIPDRRWTASGIPTGPTFAVGTQALQRELGLAVAASPVHEGWWSRLQSAPAASSARVRATWWARIWRRQAEIGMAAAPTPRADRVWVVGDALVGPSTVSGAMAQGREAARAIVAARAVLTTQPDAGGPSTVSMIHDLIARGARKTWPE